MKGPPFPLAAGGQRHTLPPCEKEGGAQPGSRGDSQKLRFWCPSRYALRLPLTSTLNDSFPKSSTAVQGRKCEFAKSASCR